MGQYFKLVNLDKQEFLNPHDFEGGSKLFECWGGVIDALFLLLTTYNAGLPTYEGQVAGRWAGDRIIIIGDYDSSGLYGELRYRPYQNIAPLIFARPPEADLAEYTWVYDDPGDG
jgi:hypothetical protein